MKTLVFLLLLHLGLAVHAGPPPENYPLVNGVVKKIDLNSGRLSIKHEEIPNLSMPGMTMSFSVQDSRFLHGLAVGDQIRFVADEVDGDITVLWLEKFVPPVQDIANMTCTGIANTTPRTSVEIEIRKDKFSTIRYEYIEGSYRGTSYVNSIGVMKITKRSDYSIATSGRAQLVYKLAGKKISEAYFTHYSSSMNSSPVRCSL